jgi:integrase
MNDIKLTKRVVDNAIPKSTRYTIFDAGDGSIKGFGIRIYPSNQKSWIFEYRAGEGGRRAAKKRLTIGSSTDFTPEQARKVAKQKRMMVENGEDPQAEIAHARKALTFAELTKIFLDEHVNPKRKAGTAERYSDALNRMVVPKLGSIPAKDITRADIARLHLSRRKTPVQANRMVAVISALYTFASKRGLLLDETNPARTIEKFPEQSRERFLSVDELEKLGAAIRDAETTGIPWLIDHSKDNKHLQKENRETIIGEHAAAALRLLIFTGARLREILHLKWSEVDIERGLLLLSDSKTGKKAIVLNAPSLDILAKLPKIGVYVIAGDSAGKSDEKPRADLKRPWTLVSRQAGLTGVRLHDLRHTYASYGAGGGMGLPIIGKLLGHAQASTTQRYAHLDSDPLRRASNTIANTLAAAMGETVSSAEIVPFKRA